MRVLPLMAALLCMPAISPALQAQTSGTTGSSAGSAGAAEALHVLNRLGYGPRPGDIEAVTRKGSRAWIEEQLQPERLDDRAVENKLANFQMLRLPLPQLSLAFYGGRALVTAAKVEKSTTGRTLNPAQQRLVDESLAAGFQVGMPAQTVGEMAIAKLVRASESPRQLQEVLVDFWTNHFNLDVNKREVSTLRVADERDAIRPHVMGKFRELLGASAHSPAMLIYLDNHRSTREMTPAGPAMMAKAPPKAAPAMGAMMNDDDDEDDAEMPAMMPAKRGGLNENYARELMELHTLGVNGGYTQKDVQEVARCFTGWSVNLQGRFVFKAGTHDRDEKLVLGQRIPAGGGVEDGERVLDILAAHPSTAKFISRKLAIRFVSDNPPAALVDRAAQTFLKTGGDLREVTRSIMLSPEFLGPTYRRQKIKSPFEFAVSAVRALDGEVWVPDPKLPRERVQLVREGTASLQANVGGGKASSSLAREIALMGQPLFAFTAPTGYSEDSQTWVSAGGLVARLNFALNLANGGVANALVDRAKLFERVDLNDRDAIIDRLNERLLAGTISASTRATLQRQSEGTPDPNKLLALTLGSPEFQRR